MKQIVWAAILIVLISAVGWAQTAAPPPSATGQQPAAAPQSSVTAQQPAAAGGASVPQAANSGLVAGSEIKGANNVVNYAEFARPRRMIFFFQADPAQFSAFDRSVLYRSVLMAVGSANPNVVLLESPETEIPPTQEGMEELARQVDADCWLRVVAVGGMSNIHIDVDTFDILKQKDYGAQVIQPGYPLDYRTISQGFWDSVAATVKNDYGAVVDTLAVTVKGVPGTTVTGLGQSSLKIGTDGTLGVTLPNPATYTINANLPGYYPVSSTFYLGYDPLTENLDQVRAARFGTDVEMEDLQFPGARFWYFPIPASLYVRAGFVTYLVGLYFVDSTPSVLRGNPLTRFSAGAGWFFTPAGSSVRFYAGGDLFLRVITGGDTFGVDSYSPFGIDPAVGLEYSPQVNLHIFAEYAPLVYYTPSSSKFESVSFPAGEVPFWYLFGTGYAANLLNVNVGVRVTW